MGMLKWSEEFEALPKQAKEMIVQRSATRTFSNNNIIYLQEDDATSFYFVLSGHVRLSYIMEDGSAILYTVVPAGQSFGELGVFDRGTYTDTASAIGDVRVLSVRTELFEKATMFKQDLQSALSRLIAKRYRTYIEVTKSLYLNNLPARLAQSLLRLVDDLGETEDYEGVRVPCLGSAVNQSDLGSMARGTRGNVNRTLKSWEREGWIAVENRRVFVLDRYPLEGLALDEDF